MASRGGGGGWGPERAPSLPPRDIDATDAGCGGLQRSNSHAGVLIVRKPDDAHGRPRGWRFVVDLRERNNTIVNVANQLPEAAMIFELLYKAKCINVFDVREYL